MTFNAMLVMWHVAVLEGIVTKYGQNRFRHVEVKLKTDRKKETGQIQDPAAASGRVTRDLCLQADTGTHPYIGFWFEILLFF